MGISFLALVVQILVIAVPIVVLVAAIFIGVRLAMRHTPSAGQSTDELRALAADLRTQQAENTATLNEIRTRVEAIEQMLKTVE